MSASLGHLSFSVKLIVAPDPNVLPVTMANFWLRETQRGEAKRTTYICHCPHGLFTYFLDCNHLYTYM